VKFLWRHVSRVVGVLWGISTLSFVLIRLNGNPAAVLAGPDSTPSYIKHLTRTLGLDHPLYRQYLSFLWQVLHLNFGQSYLLDESATHAVFTRIGASAELTGCAVLLTMVIAIPLGIRNATTKHKWESATIGGFGLLGQSIPSFVLGLLFILIFAVKLHLLPAIGRDGLRSLILPTMTLSAFLTARQMRLVNSYMKAELSSDHIRTARSLGYSDRRIYYKHAMRIVLVAVIALLGVDLGQFFAGAIIVETVFAWPGMGQLMVFSVLGRDYPVVQAGVFYIACVVLVVSIVVEIAQWLLDPRLRNTSATVGS
jgi:peptide/nickel transport system permease protein